MATTTVIQAPRFRTRSRRLQQRLAVFSSSAGFAGLIVAAVVFYFTKLYSAVADLRETNQKTLSTIRCEGGSCDAVGIMNDWDFSGSDYVVDKYTRFFLNFDPPAADFVDFPLRKSDPAFIARFPRPATFKSPSGESWRLLSTTAQLGSRSFAVMVGFAQQASWKMSIPVQSMSAIDSQLQELLAKIVALLRDNDGRLSTTAMRKITVDGYQVVDLTSNNIVAGGYWIPAYLPSNVAAPHAGTYFRREVNDLYVLKVDESERLLTLSAQSLGNVWFIMAIFCFVFLVAGTLAYVSGKTILRKYFLFSQARPEELENAIEIGENANIEFKRGINAENPNIEQILETVAAFANTDDGTLFVGIDDNGCIRGLKIDSAKQKDLLAQKIYQIIRQRIKPVPWVQVDFPELRGLTVCRIFVPRGEEPLHFLDGVLYVRYGPTDVKAEPQMVKRLLAAHAF